MNRTAILQFANQWLHVEQGTPDGSEGQRDRIYELAMVLLTANRRRDLVEIGCLNGSTTQRLAIAAREMNRKVVAIDPWTIGTQNCNGGEYENFMEAIEPFKEYVDVVRLRSDDPAVRPHIPKQLAMAFVDGLHTYEAALQDILMVQHAEVIVVDDVGMEEVHRALEDACWQTRFARRLEPVFVANYREAYLI